jgi:branched-chain amino acid transport system substrate-binding protein
MKIVWKSLFISHLCFLFCAAFLLLDHAAFATTPGNLRHIQLGIISNFSEVSASSANPYENYFLYGVELAVEDSHSILDVAKLQVDLIKFDDGNDPTKALNLVPQAADSEIVAMIGYIRSTEALLAAPLHQQYKLPMMTPTASATRLSKIGAFVHQLAVVNDVQGTMLAHIAVDKLHASKILIVTVADCAYCQDLSSSFEKYFVTKGGKITDKVLVSEGDNDYSDDLIKIDASKFDAILVPNQEFESGKIIAAILNRGIDKPFIGGDGWGFTGSQILKLVGNKNFTSYSLAHWHPDVPFAESKRFVEEFKKKYGFVPDSISALSYDATRLCLRLISELNSISRENLEKLFSKEISHDGVAGKIIFIPGKPTQKKMVLLRGNGNAFYYEGLVDYDSQL